MNRYSKERKYIIIPEYAPLYAMRHCWGPTMGPLKKPTPTPVDIIGMLLKQRGTDRVTIYEVLHNADGSYSDPVQLTLENYKLSYEAIKAGGKEDIPPAAETNETVAPTVEDDQTPEPDAEKNFDDLCNAVKDTFGKDHVTGETPDESEAENAETAKSADEDQTVESSPVEQDQGAAETAVTASNPYAGMTKAERKAARRREAELRAEEIANKAIDESK